MTDEQFQQLDGRLAECAVLLRALVAGNTWCIGRLKRIDQADRRREYWNALDDARRDRVDRFHIDRVKEMRAREAALDKAALGNLKDRAVRAGLFEELLTKQMARKTGRE